MTSTETMDRRKDDDIERTKEMFLHRTGLRNITIREEPAGPEVFYHVIVGRRSPLYDRVLTAINDELGEDSPLYGRLTVAAKSPHKGLEAPEAYALGALIRRSLTVTRENLHEAPPPIRVRFAGAEDTQVLESGPHLIWGRRGVGKSSLILHACHDLQQRGLPFAWVGAEAYQGRQDLGVVVELLHEILGEIEHSSGKHPSPAPSPREVLVPFLDGGLDEEGLAKLVAPLKQSLRRAWQDTERTRYVFVDDAHMVAQNLQPLAFRALRNVFHGVGARLKIAGVKALMSLHDPDRGISLQIPHDFQSITLDKTLEVPAATRDHLERILLQFLHECGFKGISSLLNAKAVERLVWCSAGVPRDFLWLVERAMGYARQHEHQKVGKEDVNRATGELSSEKLHHLRREGARNPDELLMALERLQSQLLDRHRRNAFLVRHDPEHPGYVNLQELVDLRLVHLLNPSITVRKAGEKSEAYLLDYSFYTGVRRRHNLTEINIDPKSPPRYHDLRKLPQIELDILAPEQPDNDALQSPAGGD